MMLITIILHTDLWDTDTQILQYDAALSALFELLFYVCLKIKNKKKSFNLIAGITTFIKILYCI